MNISHQKCGVSEFRPYLRKFRWIGPWFPTSTSIEERITPLNPPQLYNQHCNIGSQHCPIEKKFGVFESLNVSEHLRHSKNSQNSTRTQLRCDIVLWKGPPGFCVITGHNFFGVFTKDKPGVQNLEITATGSRG